jgi:hypothetical protein
LLGCRNFCCWAWLWFIIDVLFTVSSMFASFGSVIEVATSFDFFVSLLLNVL